MFFSVILSPHLCHCQIVAFPLVFASYPNPTSQFGSVCFVLLNAWQNKPRRRETVGRIDDSNSKAKLLAYSISFHSHNSNNDDDDHVVNPTQSCQLSVRPLHYLFAAIGFLFLFLHHHLRCINVTAYVVHRSGALHSSLSFQSIIQLYHGSIVSGLDWK